jgi:DNA (cytosine-5)-methyltransferase 1
MSKKTLNIISLFSGVGFQELGIEHPYNLVYWCEKDTATASIFSLLHNVPDNTNLKDITKVKVDDLKIPKGGIDVLISTFPCQSFSISGKQKGFEDEKNGNLFFHSLRIIKHVCPKVIIFENVKNIQNKKFGAIPRIKQEMHTLGYSCFDKVLNSKHFNIPQNRERWFMVCFSKEIGVDDFNFPTPIPLTRKVKDFVDTKYEHRVCDKKLIPYFNKKYHKEYRSHNGLIKVFDGVGQEYFKTGFTSHRIYSIEGICPTMTTSNDCHFLEIKGKLNALERCLLMGMKKQHYDILVQHNVSKSLIYKISGNGLVVDVFTHLYNQILTYL